MAVIDLYCLSDDQFDMVMFIDGALTINDIGVTNIDDMVTKVERRCSGGDRVEELRVTGHGDSTGQYIGSDWLDLQSLPQFRAHFNRLRNCFARGSQYNPRLTLGGCHVGQNSRLLLELGDILIVPVRAFTAAQRPAVPGDEGGEVQCFLTCTRSGSNFWNSLDKALGQD